MSKEEQNSDIFNYFIFNIFINHNIFKREKNYIPEFTHNDIPVNAKELRDIYDLVYKS